MRKIFAIALALTALFTIFFAPAINAQNLNQTSTLTSNNIIMLAGAGDTLWLATERGLNYQIIGETPSSVWNGFESNDFFVGLAVGGGGAAALYSKSQNDFGFWHFNHATQRQQRREFRFSFANEFDNDSLAPQPTGSTIFSHGNFWTPFNTGGLVRYDPTENRAYAIRVGEDESQSFSIDDNSANRVLSLDVIDTLILVTTPNAILTYNPTNKNWQTLHSAPSELTGGITFVSFNAAFTINGNDDTQTLFSFMQITENSRDTIALFRYVNSSSSWLRIRNLRDRVFVFNAQTNSFFTLSETGNNVRLYSFIDEETGNELDNLTEVITEQVFRDTLRSASGETYPQINGMIFLPKLDNANDTDSAGIFAVATRAGLYLWRSADPLAKNFPRDNFTLARHVRDVPRGEAYALPSIIRSSGDGRYDRAVFVYRLKNDGDVTIRVYDYNMSLVKTVIRNEPRRASDQRSTIPQRDFWDGTNESGRRVTPGVYYFRITTNNRERFNGRVIIAQ